MSLVEIKWNPEKRELRQFGLIAVVVLGAAGIILRYVLGAAGVWAVLLGAAGLCIFLITLVSARAGRIIYLGLTFAALPIGFVISVLLMAAFYFLVLTPVGLVFKLSGRDLLNRRFNPDAPTYWTPRQHTDDPERYFHQS
jgi:CHASE2 domain-containing sensor protein